MKKLFSIIAALALTFVGVVGASSMASATYPHECVPSEGTPAYDETVVITEAYDETVVITEAYDETIVTTEAVDKWYSWTGGPSETHPFPDDNWQPDNGNHNGFDQAPGLLQRDKGESGRSDFFYHEVVAEVTEVVHHDAVTEVIHHEAVTEIIHHDAVPPVICEEEPPTYEPTCVCVDNEVNLGSGYLEVEGDWDSDTISLPIPSGLTLADIGTVLDIDADPLQYVGLHIDLGNLGSIVFEEEPTYGGNLWSNSTWEGVNPGMGYNAFGSIEEYIHFNGNAEVFGIVVLYTHPQPSETTVQSVTIACTKYVFDNTPPTEEPTPTPTPTPTETPTPTPTPTETTTPTPTPSPSDTPVVVTQVHTVDHLAATGGPFERILPWALGFITLGAAALVLRWAGKRYSRPVE